MATKHTDGCLRKAGPDDWSGSGPIFVLRAQDVLAPGADRAERAGTPAEKVADARALADRMEIWQEARNCKVPD